MIYKIPFPLIFLLLSTTFSFSQKKVHSGFGIQYDSGVILMHTPKIGHLVTGFPNALSLSYNLRTQGKKEWEQLYHQPNINFSLSYYDYQNPSLGKSYVLTSEIHFPLLRKDKKNQLYYKLGTGIAYHTHPFDLENNPQNVVFGSPVALVIKTGFRYTHQLLNNINLIADVHIMHTSNGAYQLPNKGINVLTLGLGAEYLLKKESQTEHWHKTAPLKKNIRLEFSLSGGLSSWHIDQHKKNAVWAGSIYFAKDLSRKSKFNTGFDLFLHQGIKEQIDQIWEENKPDYKRVAWVIGHELKIGEIALLTQAGYYIYKKFEERNGAPIYYRVGLRYYISPGYIGMYLKSHHATAEVIEWTVGFPLYFRKNI